MQTKAFIVLPDVIKPRLKVVFVGMAPGRASAEVKAYYAGRGNKFWNILHQVRLTPHVIDCRQYKEVLEYGIGLTDLSKRQSGNDEVIRTNAVDRGILRQKILENSPHVFAFNGKRAAKEFFQVHDVPYGKQDKRFDFGSSVCFVLPSTSSAANRWWAREEWQKIAYYVRER